MGKSDNSIEKFVIIGNLIMNIIDNADFPMQFNENLR